MIGRLVSFWKGLFSEAMFVSGRVYISIYMSSFFWRICTFLFSAYGLGFDRLRYWAIQGPNSGGFGLGAWVLPSYSTMSRKKGLF